MNRALARSAIFAAVFAVLLLGACGSDDGGSDATSATPATDAAGGASALVIQDFAYADVQGARAGRPITVENKDTVGHTVTADDDSFEVSVAAGGTATLTVDEAGTYAFHCEIHPSMTGTLTVG